MFSNLCICCSEELNYHIDKFDTAKFGCNKCKYHFQFYENVLVEVYILIQTNYIFYYIFDLDGDYFTIEISDISGEYKLLYYSVNEYLDLNFSNFDDLINQAKTLAAFE